MRSSLSFARASLATVALCFYAVPAHVACSGSEDTPSGQPGSGGQATGGAPSTGGTSTGGAPATGGVAPVTGGSSATGGASPTGGAPSAGSGGTAAGGSSGAAGAPSQGGVAGGGAGGVAGGGAGGAAAGGGAGGAMGGGGGSGGAQAGGGGGGAGGGADVAKSAGCGKTRTLMNGRKTIQSGGNREYILRVPDNYDNTRPYRLIMAYHWLNGNADQVANGGMNGSTEKPYYGLWELAAGSTIFVAPQGLNAGWSNTNGADVTLTDAILEQVLGDLCIDTTRIFATGFSFGGGMSFALACARPQVFRAVAVYSGAQLSGCSGGTTPVAYFATHGLGDSVLRISQGRPLRDKFVMLNGCTQMNPPEPSQGSGTHTCTSYEGCMPGKPVRWCAFDGDHNPTQKDRNQNDSWVPGEAWKFISQF